MSKVVQEQVDGLTRRFFVPPNRWIINNNFTEKVNILPEKLLVSRNIANSHDKKVFFSL